MEALRYPNTDGQTRTRNSFTVQRFFDLMDMSKIKDLLVMASRWKKIHRRWGKILCHNFRPKRISRRRVSTSKTWRDDFCQKWQFSSCASESNL